MAREKEKKYRIQWTSEELTTLIAGRTDEQIGAYMRALQQAGRPSKVLDMVKVAALYGLGCSITEIAAQCGCSEKAIDRRLAKDPGFREAMRRGESNGKLALRQAQFNAAVVDRNPTMQIFLGKQRLGQIDERTMRVGAGGKNGDGKPQQVTITMSVDDVNL